MVWKSSKNWDFQLKKVRFIVGTDEESGLGRHGLLLWTCRTGNQTSVPLQTLNSHHQWWKGTSRNTSTLQVKQAARSQLHRWFAWKNMVPESATRLFQATYWLGKPKLDALSQNTNQREIQKKTVNGLRLPSLVNQPMVHAVSGANGAPLALFLS